MIQRLRLVSTKGTKSYIMYTMNIAILVTREIQPKVRDTEEGKSRITHFEKIFGFKNISSNLQFTSDSQWNKTYFFNSADFKL